MDGLFNHPLNYLMQPTLQDIIIGWAPNEFANLHVPFNKGKAQDGLHDRFEMRFLKVTEAIDWPFTQPLILVDQARGAENVSASSTDEAPHTKRQKFDTPVQSGGGRNGLEPKAIGALVQWYRLCDSWNNNTQFQRCSQAMDNLFNARQNITDQVKFKMSW